MRFSDEDLSCNTDTEQALIEVTWVPYSLSFDSMLSSFKALRSIIVAFKTVYNFNIWQENSPNLGMSHHLEVMRHVHLYSHTGELTQPWCEP